MNMLKVSNKKWISNLARFIIRISKSKIDMNEVVGNSYFCI